MRLSIVAAVAENGVIGSAGSLPWHLPADFRHFKRTTVGHHLIMGRRTWDSIGRALPDRTTVVVSRGTPELPVGVLSARSLEEAIALALEHDETEAFVAGGAEIYRQALPLADRLYLTRVAARPAGDTLFPEIEAASWRLRERRDRPADEANRYAMSFLVYERLWSRD